MKKNYKALNCMEKFHLTDDASIQEIVLHLVMHVVHVWTIHTKTQVGDQNTHMNSVLAFHTYYLWVLGLKEITTSVFLGSLSLSAYRSSTAWRQHVGVVFGDFCSR